MKYASLNIKGVSTVLLKRLCNPIKINEKRAWKWDLNDC